MPTNIVSVLNELAETSKDGERGFRKAAEDAHDQLLKVLFQNRADECALALRELQNLVRDLGGKPETHGTVSGALHRGWLDVKSALTGRNDHAILVECEKAEDIAKSRYRTALDEDLPADVRATVERQYQGLLKTHDRIRELRDQFAAAKS
jgi:uncharacterized protein (TIGR02284 family)